MKTTFHGIAQNAHRTRVVRLRGGLPSFVDGVESLKLFWQLGMAITIY